MSSVDNRIVEMEFSNKQFNSNAASSEKALLSLEKAIGQTANSKGMTGLDGQVKQVTTSFSAMQVAGAAALGTIVSKATSAGLSLAKKLTISPLMDGFREYQTGLDSIQTIMANTGKGVKTVNKALDQLNHYADQTIYNFGQMAKNVGTFTAAGVDLKTSVASIKGIANLAALSGSSSEQASMAMYQLSQAIAAGKVGLQDWNSVVNAGMGGKIFQSALARTAQNMGELTASAVALEGPMKKLTINGESFRESISAAGGGPAWLTSDVLVETLKQISGGYSQAELMAKGYNEEQAKAIIKMQEDAFNAATQIKTLPQLFGVIQESIGSTWAGVFRTIMGDFAQSKHLWSEAGLAIIGPQGFLTQAQDGLTNFVKEWAKMGGREEVIKGFQRTYKTLRRIFVNLGQAWREVFPPSSNNVLFQMSQGFNDLTKKLRPTKDTMDALQDIFGGVFAVMHIGYTVVSALSTIFMGFLSGLYDGTRTGQSGILDLLAAVGRLAMSIDDFLTNGLKVRELMTEIGHVGGVFLSPLIKALGLVGEAFSALIRGEGLDGFLEPLRSAGGIVVEFASRAVGALAVLTAPFERISNFFEGLRSKLDGLGAGLPDVSSAFGGDQISAAADQAKKGADVISGSMEKVKGSVDKIGGAVTSAYAAFSGGSAAQAADSTKKLASSADGMGLSWENARNNLSTVGEGIITVIKKIGGVIGWIKDQFADLFGGMDALEWASVLNAVFTGAVLLTFRKFIQNLGGFSQSIRETFGAVTDTLETMQSAIKAKMILDIAIAVGILAASLLVLSFIDPKNLAKGLGAIAIMIGLLVGSLVALSKINGEMSMAALAASMLLISAAMINLALAVTILGNQDLETLQKGLGAMAIALGTLVAALFAMSKMSGSIEGMAGSLFVMALAMNALAAAVLAFGSQDLNTLKKGLGAMAIGLGLLIAAMAAMSKMKGSIEGGAASILVMALAMNVLAAAVLAFGNMDMATLKQGFTSVAIGLGLMVGAIALLAAGGKNTLMAAGAMAIMAAAMNMLVGVILILGTAPWEVVKQGLIAVAIGFGILLAAALLAIPLQSGLYALGASVALLGAGLFLAGAGMAAFGTGFALMAATGVAGVAVMVTAFQAFMALLPSFAVQVAAAFVAFLKAMAAASPKIRTAMSTIFENMIGVVIDAIPVIGRLMQRLIDTAIGILTKSIPQWIEMGFTIIDEFLNSAEEHVPNIAESASNLIVGFINELSNHTDRVIKAGTRLIITFIRGLGEAAADITKAAAQTILDLLNAIDQAVVDYSGEFRSAGLRIAGHLIDGLTGGLGSKALGGVRGALGGIRDLVGRSMAGRGPGANPRVVADRAVRAALAVANANLANGSPTVSRAASAAASSQGTADKAQRQAEIQARLAEQADRKAAAAENKAKTKNQKKRAAKLRKNANRAQNRAESAQNAADSRQAEADAKAENLAWQIRYRDADAQGRGEMQEEKANELATRANQLLQKANAEAAAAKKLRGKERAAMQAQSERTARQAKAAADQALAADREADRQYGIAVSGRIKELEAQRAADKKAREDQAAYDAADTAGKQKIMEQRAKDSQAAADTANKLVETNLAQAKLYAATDADRAQKFLDAATEQAAIAKEAEDRAIQEKQQAEQLASQSATDAATGGGQKPGLPTITPSRGILESAARDIDRYNETLAQATELAASNGDVTYIQNNYSPVALPASEIYRQGKNLISAAETNMSAPN